MPDHQDRSGRFGRVDDGRVLDVAGDRLLDQNREARLDAAQRDLGVEIGGMAMLTACTSASSSASRDGKARPPARWATASALGKSMSAAPTRVAVGNSEKMRA